MTDRKIVEVTNDEHLGAQSTNDIGRRRKRNTHGQGACCRPFEAAPNSARPVPPFDGPSVRLRFRWLVAFGSTRAVFEARLPTPFWRTNCVDVHGRQHTEYRSRSWYSQTAYMTGEILTVMAYVGPA